MLSVLCHYKSERRGGEGNIAESNGKGRKKLFEALASLSRNSEFYGYKKRDLRLVF
jgi:hypothetical protein